MYSTDTTYLTINVHIDFLGGMWTGYEVDRLHINTGCKVFVRTLAYIGFKGLSILDSCNVKSCTMWDPNMLSYLHHGNQGPDVGKFKSEFPSDFLDRLYFFLKL